MSGSNRSTPAASGRVLAVAASCSLEAPFYSFSIIIKVFQSDEGYRNIVSVNALPFQLLGCDLIYPGEDIATSFQRPAFRRENLTFPSVVTSKYG